MIPFKSILACLVVAGLLAACNRAQPPEGDAFAELAPEPAAVQTWEPIARSTERPLVDRAAPGAAAGRLPGQVAGPSGTQPAKAGFPEGALTARQPPVPDEILAAEMAAADAAAASARHQMPPGPPRPPGTTQSQPQAQPRPTNPSQSPDLDVERGNH